ncbi:MAG TPA: GMC family oxidoreductase N-terminal domain-containing protein [Bradyrhizobium sp.]|nr:GMC family oxidoreductase N-terminal domain-containing protein [Bradyrhizobium sp.]
MDIGSGNSFDYIIVGGGSAGCVLASRLSSDPAFRVLLVEAGPDFGPGGEPEELVDPRVRSFMLHQYFWPGLFTSDGPRPKIIMQAKVIGGGSMINGMHAQRGVAEDYDEWRQYGVEGWGWKDVLPYFMRLENDTDFRSAMHGDAGPIEIRRVPEMQWSRLSLALRESLERRGLARLRDLNSEGGDGTGPVPININKDQRISAASAYLKTPVRQRANLKILANTSVTRVLLSGRRATGIELADGTIVAGGSIIISAGAIHSPFILLRSGIGPGKHLQERGVTVLAERAGVGQNLRTHPILTIMTNLRRQGRQLDSAVRPPVPMGVRYSSNLPGCQPTDMMLDLWERNPGPLRRDPMNRQLALIMVLLNKSYSQGEVRLAAAGGSQQVEVLGSLRDARDLDRMVQGFLMIRDMVNQEPMKSLVYRSFIPKLALGSPPSFLMRKLLRDTAEARLISRAGALAADYLPGMRNWITNMAGLDVRDVPTDPDKLAELVHTATSFGGHPGGTCRMGSAQDSHSVVDSGCRVISMENLHVVDASIFPTLMRAGTNLPVIMAAEKAADAIINDRRRTGTG